MLQRNSYTWAGLGLLVTGLPVAAVAFFVLRLTWLTALGVSMLILSFVLLALSRTIPRLPPEVGGLLLETGVDNMAKIVEELGIKGKAIYLPSSLTGSKPQALIPLHANPALSRITKTLPQRLIIRHGSRPDDIGLLFSTVGSATFSLLETKPRPTSVGLESALTTLLAGTLGIADKTRVTCHQKLITVEVFNSRLENRTNWCHDCLGGPLASIVATVAAEAWDQPVTVKYEEQTGGKCLIELEVTGEDIQ